MKEATAKPKTGLERAIDAAGSAAELARYLKVTHQAIYYWKVRGWVPAERALQIERKYEIPRASLVSPRLRRVLAAATRDSDSVI
tara:strand:+ start:732 stop:986 length:255 start_codon:yes stop_codon:yes gene_type:complete